MRGPTCIFWAALTPSSLQFSDFVLAGREVLVEPGGGRAKARIQPPPALREAGGGRNRRGFRGLFLNPPGLFLRTSILSIWRILSAFLPA
jgi:hypothetical protein